MDRFAGYPYEEFKRRVLDCSMLIQRLTFKGLNPEEVFNECIKQKFEPEICCSALDMLMSITKNSDEKKEIDKCMDYKKSEIDKMKTSDEFYSICEAIYLDKMMNSSISGMPICFMLNKTQPKIGIVPMNNGVNRSPMDLLKDIVYEMNPEAYCFCGEASMVRKSKDEADLSGYKYGDIQNDPQSMDCVVIVGNNRSGQEQFTRVYKMIKDEKTNRFIFDLFEESGNNMESDKLP